MDGPVSSTAIRRLLAAGDVEGAAGAAGAAARGAGAWSGRATSGARELGFPTANVEVPPDILLPAVGIYAGWYVRPDGSCHPSAISLGVRPDVPPRRQPGGAGGLPARLRRRPLRRAGRVRFARRLGRGPLRLRRRPVGPGRGRRRSHEPPSPPATGDTYSPVRALGHQFGSAATGTLRHVRAHVTSSPGSANWGRLPGTGAGAGHQFARSCQPVTDLVAWDRSGHQFADPASGYPGWPRDPSHRLRWGPVRWRRRARSRGSGRRRTARPRPPARWWPPGGSRAARPRR